MNESTFSKIEWSLRIVLIAALVFMSVMLQKQKTALHEYNQLMAEQNQQLVTVIDKFEARNKVLAKIEETCK